MEFKKIMVVLNWIFFSEMRLLILLPLVIGWVSSKQMDDLKEIYENPLAHGFGNDIDWVQWDDAIEKALDENKPIFLLIHKTWCHACKGRAIFMENQLIFMSFIYLVV